MGNFASRGARRRWAWAMAWLAAIVSLPSCEWVAGLDKREVYRAKPRRDLSQCSLARSGNSLLRLAHVVPRSERYDICLRPSGQPASGPLDQALFASAGDACSLGLGYKDVTTPVSVAAGTYDLRWVRASASPCQSGDAVAATTVDLKPGLPTDVYAFEEADGSVRLKVLGESRPLQPSSVTTRLFHGALGPGPLDFGYTEGTALPTRLLTPVRLGKVSFGNTEPADKSSGADAQGYVSQQLGGVRAGYGVSVAGQSGALLLTEQPTLPGSAYTFFLTGKEASKDFPLEFFACNETVGSGVLAACGRGPGLDITVDTVNLQLSGPFAAAEAARRDVGLKALNGLGSDIACITEVFQKADRDAIVKNVGDSFAYYLEANTDDSSTPFDPRTLSGDVPALETTPPCGSALPAMNVAVDCLRDGCATEAKESGIAIQSPSACVLDKCRDPLATLVSSADTQRCALCLFANYNSYEPMESIRARCGGQVTGGTGFRGQSGVLLLSKFPIGKDASFRVLPFVNVWRTTILRAPITLPNGAQLDVYCTTAASVLDDCTLSRWIGPYGKPATDCVSASRREQLLHFKNITDFVRQESVRTRRKAIVSGDFYAGPAGAGLAGLNEDNFATLTQEFSLGIADNFTPQCTFCSDNPIQTPPGNPPVGQSTWTRFNFLVNIAKSDVLANDTLLKAPLVKANPGNGASAIPLSQYYGFRSLVRLRP